MQNITVFFAFRDDPAGSLERWLTVQAPNAFKARLMTRAAYPSRKLLIFRTVTELGPCCKQCGSPKPVGQSCDCFDNNCQ